MRLLVSALLVILMTGSVHAQYGTAYITYDIAPPTGKTKDFIDKASWRGIGVGVRKYLIPPELSIGLSWQWNTFQETTRNPIEMDGIAVSGDQVRRIFISPILVNADYHLPVMRDQLYFEPFVSLGVGAYYIEKRLDIGITRFEEKNWHFGFEPRAGIRVPVYGSINGLLILSYHHVFEAGDGTAHSFFDLGIGLAYRR